MKKIILMTLIIAAFAISINAQNFKKLFLGSDFMYYEGALFTLGEKPQIDFGIKLYKSYSAIKATYSDDVFFPSRAGYSDRDSISGKIFRVDRIYRDMRPIFVLADTATGVEYYYKYDELREHDFQFLVKPIMDIREIYCNQIDKRIDKFTNEVTINSPILNTKGRISPCILYKKNRNGAKYYYLDLNAMGLNCVVDGRGIIILFDDGSKLNRYDEIDIDVADNGWFRYSAYIQLNSTELKQITTKKIKAFRLNIFDYHLDIEEMDLYKDYFNCVVEKK